MGTRGSDTRCELRTSAAYGVLRLMRERLMVGMMMMLTVMTMMMMNAMLMTVMARTGSRTQCSVVADASQTRVAAWWAHLRTVRASAMVRWAMGMWGVIVLSMPLWWRRNWTCMMQMMMHGVVDTHAGQGVLMMMTRVCVRTCGGRRMDVEPR